MGLKVKTLTWQSYVKKEGKKKRSNVIDLKKEREKRSQPSERLDLVKKGAVIKGLSKKEIERVLRAAGKFK